MRVSKAVVPNAWERTSPSTNSANHGVPRKLGCPAACIAFAIPGRRCAGALSALKRARKVPMSTTVKRTCDQSSDALGFRPSRYCASHLRQKPQSAAETYSSSTVESRRASCAGAAVQNMSSTLAMTEATEAGLATDVGHLHFLVLRSFCGANFRIAVGATLPYRRDL